MDQVTDYNELKGFDDYHVRLGDRLRGERATLGLTLPQISKELHIREEILQAIEDVNPDGFPSHSYIAGNVRAYARFLGVDPELAFGQFCEESGFIGVTGELNEARKTTKIVATKQAPKMVLNPYVKSEQRRKWGLQDITIGTLTSIVAVIAVIGLIGFGASLFLKEIQRVELAPANTLPDITASLDLPEQLTSEENIAQDSVSLTSLERQDRPRELLLPRLTPREAPIATLDVSEIGAYAIRPELTPTTLEAPQTVLASLGMVDIYAAEPAWIRVYQPDGQILFEKILDAGQRYRVPSTADNVMLKAGNARAVYLLIGDEAFGPVSATKSVARDVILSESSVRETYENLAAFEVETTQPVNLESLASN